MASHQRRPSPQAPSPSLRSMLAVFVLVASCLMPTTTAFYLPGSAPRSFAPGDPVPLLVNALQPQMTSKKRLQSLLPYDYYNPAFHFCRPGDGKTEPKKVSESLGSVLFGDRLYESPFEVRHTSIKTPREMWKFHKLSMLSDCLCTGADASKHIMSNALQVHSTSRRCKVYQ